MTEKITKNFYKNIEYIRYKQPKLFKMLESLDSAVSNGFYKEKYELVYEDNMFDVFEKESGKYLYSQKSTQYTQRVNQSIDFKVEENTFEGFERVDISNEELKRLETLAPFTHYRQGFAPIIEYIQKQRKSEKREIKSIEKFIFFGVGLGLHIEEVAKKIKSKVYFIVEDDLELFRLSLFTIDYEKLAQDAILIFSVFEDDTEFQESANLFLKTKYYYNSYIKYFNMLSHSEEKRYKFHLSITSQSHTRFFYNALLTQMMKPFQYIFDNYKFLGDDLTFQKLNEKPFLLLAAGPSLGKNIEWLKDNYKKFTVVAVSAIANILEKEKIIPDILIHLDPFKPGIKHFKKIKSIQFFEKTIFFFMARVEKEIVEMFPKENIFLFESGTNYKKNTLKTAAPCIGSVSYQLLLKLQVKELYLLGLDLAIDTKTGKTHTSSHEFIQELGVKADDKDNECMTYKTSLLEIEGNFEPITLTTPHFKTSIDSINLSSRYLKQKDQSIYNLSNGAKFDNVASLLVTNINLKNNNEKLLKRIVKKNSSKNLTKDEQLDMVDKLNYVNILVNKIENLQNLESIIIFAEFIADTKKIDKYELHFIIDTYLRSMLLYIFDFYSDTEIVSDDNINQLLQQHLKEICIYYKDSLTKVIEGE